MSAGDPDPAQTAAGHPPDTLIVDGPTVLAFFATTQAEIDGDGDQATALNDFQYYLPVVRDSLQHRAVGLREYYGDSLLVIRGREAELFLPREHLSAVGYVLYAPNRTPRILYGVMTDADLLADASEYFEW